MIPITIEQAKAYCIQKIENTISYYYDMGYTLKIKDIDDLHDCTIEDIELDSLYYALNALLPQVFDDCANYLDDEYDYWDGNAEYYRNVFGH